ncbi:CYTH and CHAD domain-containing protein [Streptomyces sp. 549]|uniref:CYTH and CHAD domain-containing protein n=1 Tax=Streptomyces sp. 549 TaxID=3049076 RepID=UPI0024C371F2|nr:CYTH and CHAD domain-containing protein [Streptomyces sp. 549]MDK1474396.1 CYTH and CHAD domain-containing protein [Streptomyces sp. 549]
MVAVVRETERKYETEAGREIPSAELAGLAGVAGTTDSGSTSLDALYYDTRDRRLAAEGITLRRRSGGHDAGWHLKMPLEPGVREEIQAPDQEELPAALAGLVRSRVRDHALEPVMRLRTRRAVTLLHDTAGDTLAEVAVDEVEAEHQTTGRTAGWTETEVELVSGDPALLDTVEERLLAAGLRPASHTSKLQRARVETADPGHQRGSSGSSGGDQAEQVPPPATAGEAVLGYVRAQVRALVELDPAVRRDAPDSVHRMRVATRRLRSALRTHRAVLDATATAPVVEELRWLTGELGVDRDREVLADRLQTAVDDLPRALRTGPVRGRLRLFDRARRSGTRRRLVTVLDSRRYLDLLDSLDSLLAEPPMLAAAHRPAAKVMAKAVRRDFDRLAARVGEALAAEPGPERDEAVHTARKAAKRTRYAAEAARPVLGKPAKRYVRHMKALQSLLGEHQDSVVARGALRELAAQAQAAGEPSFTYGVLHEREAQRATRCEEELPREWSRITAFTASDRAGRLTTSR